MRTVIHDQSDPNRTVRQALPYKFQMFPGGKLRILNTRNQTLFVTKGQVETILQKDDLDAHRRRMYEAALNEFQKAECKMQNEGVQ